MEKRALVVRRGDVWWVDFGLPIGSGPGFRRPVVVVQADTYNASRIGTVVVVPLTGNLRRAASSGNVLLPRAVTKLRKDSVANVSQVAAVDRSLLVGRIARLPAILMAELDEGLRSLLDL